MMLFQWNFVGELLRVCLQLKLEVGPGWIAGGEMDGF